MKTPFPDWNDPLYQELRELADKEWEEVPQERKDELKGACVMQTITQTPEWWYHFIQKLLAKRKFVVIVPGESAPVELRQAFGKDEFNGNYQDYGLRNNDIIEISGEIKINQLKGQNELD